MSTQRWLQVKQILERVMTEDRRRHSGLLDELCAGDAGLRSEVDGFLAHDDDSLAEPSLGMEILENRTLGPYRILREIGRGGMGVVYLAERADRLYEKQVAVKVLASALQPGELVRRFAAERRILAQLEHPSIARLLDAGLLDGSKPYLVLEYVDGMPLTEFADAHALSEKERLELYLKVCDGVSAAHRQLIVHLDVKPGNILVGADGSPKILDFGVAKILDPDTGVTGGGNTLIRILTPGYASPEQIAGRAVTVASDIYSLGVVLQELLTGERPGGTAPTRVRGDLDSVIRKAQATEPERRYRSVDQLAEDVERYRAGKPVIARDATWRYRVARFLGRHRLSVGAAAIAVLGLLLALALAVHQSRLAQRRFLQVQTMANSLVFEFHDAIRDLPGALPARELVVKRAIEYLDLLSREAGGDNSLKKNLAESYFRVGDVQGLYFEANLGRTAEAMSSYRKALRLLEEVAASQPLNPMAKADVAEAHIRIATTLDTLEDHEGAMRERAEAETTARSSLIHILPLDIVLTKVSFGNAEGLTLMHRLPEALDARREALSRILALVRSRPNDPRLTRFEALAHKRYGAALMNDQKTFDEAQAQIEAALHIDREAAQPHNVAAQGDLALDLYYRGCLDLLRHELDTAGQDLEQARIIYQVLVAADGKDVRNRSFLTHTEERLAEVRRQQRDAAGNR